MKRKGEKMKRKKKRKKERKRERKKERKIVTTEAAENRQL